MIQFEFTKLEDGRDYFYMNVDRKQLREGGHKALSEFLAKLHTLKSLGDFETAKAWFDGYSAVDEEMQRIKELIELHKKPRRLELQPNLFEGDNDIVYKDYSEDFEGIINSYCERFGPVFMKDVYDEWLKNADKCRYD